MGLRVSLKSQPEAFLAQILPQRVHEKHAFAVVDGALEAEVLYELLSGRHPSAAGAAPRAEAMHATLCVNPTDMVSALRKPQREGAAPWLNAADARNTPMAQLRSQLCGDLNLIVACALRKDPLQRYQSVTAMSQDVRRYLASEPVSAHPHPHSLLRRGATFVRRHRGAVAAGVLVMSAVAAGWAAA